MVSILTTRKCQILHGCYMSSVKAIQGTHHNLLGGYTVWDSYSAIKNSFSFAEVQAWPQPESIKWGRNGSYFEEVGFLEFWLQDAIPGCSHGLQFQFFKASPGIDRWHF